MDLQLCVFARMVELPLDVTIGLLHEIALACPSQWVTYDRLAQVVEYYPYLGYKPLFNALTYAGYIDRDGYIKQNPAQYEPGRKKEEKSMNSS
jgi:hypothetical protein